MFLRLTLSALVLAACSGCAVVAVADAVVTTTAVVVKTGVKATGAVVEKKPGGLARLVQPRVTPGRRLGEIPPPKLKDRLAGTGGIRWDDCIGHGVGGWELGVGG